MHSTSFYGKPPNLVELPKKYMPASVKDIRWRLQQAAYVCSTATIRSLPPDAGAEIMFVGRSNSGKSSVINAICSQNHLAKTSKSPGRTATINFFVFSCLCGQSYLVDCPGYGYAKAPKHLQKAWPKLTEHYLKRRAALRAAVVVADCRHWPSPLDLAMLDFLVQIKQNNVAIHIVLNKCDKLKSNAISKQKRDIQSLDLAGEREISVQHFSSHTKFGCAELLAKIAYWAGKSDSKNRL